jgi:hypothetical protein
MPPTEEEYVLFKGIAAGDCPDCNGTFWVYPDGPEGGVKKCSHPKLKRIGK